MIFVLFPLMLEAALRALLASLAVWAGLRLLRVANVVVLKAAWALVLIAALALPLAPGWPGLPAWAVLKLPAMPSWTVVERVASTPAENAAPQPLPATVSEAVSPAADLYSGRYPAPAISGSHSDSSASPVVNADPASEAASPVSEPDTLPQATVSTMAAKPANDSPATPKTARLAARLAAIGMLLYVAVAAALFLRLLVGLTAALRLWINAEPVPALPAAASARSARLRSSTRVASPVNIGSGIVLPAEYSTWDEEKLRIVLAHERSHIRQGDFYLQMLAGLYACLFWFSPLGWWLKRKLYELGEAISDRAGLEEAASRSSYAQLLLEFAALPRPTLTGVAMARTNHLAQRIERLLNESSFRQAFAACSRRALLAAIIVPVALLAATALVRVQAATPAAQVVPAIQAAAGGQSTPEQVVDQAPAPVPAPAPVTAPPSPAQTAMPSPAHHAQPVPPLPLSAPAGPAAADVPSPSFNSEVTPRIPNPEMGALPPMPRNLRITPEMRRFRTRDFAYALGQEGDPYAVVDADGKMIMPQVMSHRDEGPKSEEIEKARKQAHGAFLWFQHDGKSYIIDDPSIVSQIEAMNKPMEDLQVQMRDLGKQMRELGDQQRAKARQMREINVQTPDLSKEIADLKAAEASLQSRQGATISQKDLADLQREIGRVQGELGALQGKIGIQQGAFGKELGTFGQQQGKLGGQMGKLGAEMGRAARENHLKVKGIITDSLSNGKARPVQ